MIILEFYSLGCEVLDNMNGYITFKKLVIRGGLHVKCNFYVRKTVGGEVTRMSRIWIIPQDAENRKIYRRKVEYCNDKLV